MLKNLDFLSSKPEILIFGDKQTKSYFGATFSILNYIACFTLMAWFFQDWLFWSKPQLIQTVYTDINTMANLSEYPIAFNLLNSSFQPFMNQERIFGIEALQYNSIFYSGSKMQKWFIRWLRSTLWWNSIYRKLLLH